MVCFYRRPNRTHWLSAHADKLQFSFPVDTEIFPGYNTSNFIGQFVTILSVNKTRDFDGRNAPVLFCMGADCAHFSVSY